MTLKDRLRRHVTGAIERGEQQALVEQPAYIHLCSHCLTKQSHGKPVQVAGEYLTGKTLCGHCGHSRQTMMYRTI